jgi:hypothetical protein
MHCSKCGTESTSGRKFCPECGSPLSNRCTKCGADNWPTAKFCEDCGASLRVASVASVKKSNDSQIGVAETLANENNEGERKTVTPLFADIKSSTELERDLDPEEARAIIDPALRLMINAVNRYGGYLVQRTGDGVFAVFGAPVAYDESLSIRTSSVEARNPSVLAHFCESTGTGGMRPVRRALLVRKELCQGQLRPNSSISTGRQGATIAEDGQLGACFAQARRLGGRENGQKIRNETVVVRLRNDAFRGVRGLQHVLNLGRAHRLRSGQNATQRGAE